MISNIYIKTLQTRECIYPNSVIIILSIQCFFVRSYCQAWNGNIAFFTFKFFQST